MRQPPPTTSANPPTESTGGERPRLGLDDPEFPYLFKVLAAERLILAAGESVLLDSGDSSADSCPVTPSQGAAQAQAFMALPGGR